MMVLTNQHKKSNTKKLLNLNVNNKYEIINKESNFINGGVYIVSRKIFKFLNNKKQSLENEIIPRLINDNKVIGIKSKAKFIDIGTPKNFIKSKKILSNFDF